MADDTPKTAKPATRKAPSKPRATASNAKVATKPKVITAAKPNTRTTAAKPKVTASNAKTQAKSAFADLTGTTSQSLKDGAAKFTKEATGKARAYAEDGKSRAGGVLDELSRMMNDAAGTVDEKVGAQYGQYARSAADAVSNFSESLKAKNIDDLIGDARDFARKSPAVAIGTAAALGFVLVRLLKSGVESDGKA